MKYAACATSDEEVFRDRLAGHLLESAKRFRLIDLFCGAGGMTLGFSSALGHVFESVWANDIDEFACATYNRNFGNHCVSDSIESILKKRRDEIPTVDVVIGGPPCQGFSLLNKNRLDDDRKHLWRPFLKAVELSRASIFVMENVPQVLGSAEFFQIRRAAEAKGFEIWADKLSAADYGVPQGRTRAFIVGCKFADPRDFFPPKKTHFNPQLALQFGPEYVSSPEPWLTVRNAIGDLPQPVGTEIRAVDWPLNLHFGRTPTSVSLRRYQAIPEQGMNRFDLQRNLPRLTPRCWIRKKTGGTDLFGRLWWDRPAFTVRTEFFKPEKGRYLHPEQHRPITHREAARLQSFPDSFSFEGSKIEIARQIGNAVPPVLAARIADCVYCMLQSQG